MQSKSFRAIVPLLAILTLSAPLGATLADPDDPTDIAHTNVGVLDPADGCAEWDTEDLIRTAAYQEAFNHYDDMPGFVDLLFIDEADPLLVAMFDVDHMDGALPEGIAPVHDIPVVVQADVFEPLMADYSALPQSGLPPLPSSCGGIQPGTRLVIGNAGCSANFLYTDQAGVYYLGTAGHCGGLGARVSIGNEGPSGTIIYRINGGVGSDFAMIRIDDDKQHLANPAMCYWGGPEDIHGGGGGRALHYGFPFVYSIFHQTRPRVGEVSSTSGANSFSIMGLVASGDSGSGAQHAHGGALGTLTHVNLPLVIVAHSGPFAYGTKVTRGIALAEAATGLDFEIVTAPLNVQVPP